ncbi:MAG TPA: MATE family efflux transporter, partial [Holophaga sp.]|nr:MATE family efflux transporter [Holophaga sp.]
GGGTIVGQCLGANRLDRAERTARTTSIIGGTTVSLAMLVAFIFPRPILGLFVDAPEVIALGVPMLRILGIAFSIVSFAVALGCVFSGSGHNMPFLVSSMAGRWGTQVPILLLGSFVLPRFGFDPGLIAVWLSFLASDLVESVLLFKAYRKGVWKHIRI